MDSMILGRYVSGNSIIHRLDPRSKLLSMFFFILIKKRILKLISFFVSFYISLDNLLEML